jgi:hypothetical protein
VCVKVFCVRCKLEESVIGGSLARTECMKAQDTHHMDQTWQS